MPPGVGDWHKAVSEERAVWTGRSVGSSGDGAETKERLQQVVCHRALLVPQGLDLEELRER